MKKWLPLLVVSLGTFMLLIDVTIVNVALPAMAESLSTSFSVLQWVVDAYALALAALLLGVGGLADRVGHRHGYVGGLILFAAASLVCGFASRADLLVAARAVQGVGAAGMFATTFPLLNRAYAGRDRGVAYGIWGAVAGAAAAVGPLLGGVLTQGLSWNWIFFVNLPVSAVAVTMALRVLPADRPETARRIDLPGIAAFTLGAGALTFGLIEAGSDGWASATAWVAIGLAALGFTAFVVVEATVAEPMVDLSLLRRPSFAAVLLAALLLNFSAFAALTYTSIWLQSLLGLSPIEAGLVGMPLAVCSFLVSASVGRMLHSRAAGPIIGGGLLLIGAGALVDAVVISADSSWPALVAGFLITGVGVGLATPTLSSSATAAVPLHRGGMAAGMVNTMRQLGFAIGIAVLGSVFASAATSKLSNREVPDAAGTAHLLAGGQAQGVLARSGAGRSSLVADLHVAAAGGLDAVFLLTGLAAVVGGLIVLVLMRSRRSATSAASSEMASTA